MAFSRFLRDAAREFSLEVYLRFGLADAVGDCGGEEAEFEVRDSGFVEGDDCKAISSQPSAISEHRSFLLKADR